MIHEDGIEVFIKSISRGQAYDEYHGQSSSTAVDTGSMERYIEVNTGEHFAVVVKTHPHFDFEGATSIRVSRLLNDDKKWRRHRYIPLESTMNNKSSGSCNDEWFESKFHAPGGWEWFKPAFAPIQFDESISITGADVHERMSKLGKIQVTIERGFRRILGEMTRGEVAPTPAVEASKLAALGHSHTIVSESTGKKATPAQQSEWKPLQKTKSSEPYVFTFRYRSRRKSISSETELPAESTTTEALQQLGIIPASPEPAPQQLLADSTIESNSVLNDINEAKALNGQTFPTAASAADGSAMESRATLLSRKRDHEQHTELSIAVGLATDSDGRGLSKRMKTETEEEKQIIELSDDDNPSSNPRSLASSAASPSTFDDGAMYHDEQDLRDDLRRLEIEKAELAIKKKLRDIQKGKGKRKATGDVKQENA